MSANNDFCIFDIGSHSCKIGTTASEKILIEPSYLKKDSKRFYVVECGLVVNWERFAQFAESSMRAVMNNNTMPKCALFTETIPNGSNKMSRQALTQLAMETWEMDLFAMVSQAACVVTSANCTSGFALCSGHGTSMCVPVYESCIVTTKPLSRMDCGVCGNDIRARVGMWLSKQQNAWSRENEEFVVNHLACNLDIGDTEFCLPDGNKLVMPKQDMIAFSSSLFQTDNYQKLSSLQYLINSQLANFPELPRVVVAAGGNTMYSQYEQRLTMELNKPDVQLVFAPDRLTNTFNGAKILASMSTFAQSCVSKQDYEEMGPTITSRMCVQ